MNVRHGMAVLHGLSMRARMGAMLAVVISVVAATLGGVIGHSSAVQLRGRIGQSLANDAARLTDRIAAEWSGRVRELALVAVGEPRGGGWIESDNRQQAMLEGLKRAVPAYRWIVVTDAHGQVKRATDPAMLGTRVAGPALTGGSFAQVSSPVPGADGAPDGTVVAELGLDWLGALTTQVLSPERHGRPMREAVIVGRDGVVVLGPAALVAKRLTTPELDRTHATTLASDAQAWPDGCYLSAIASVPEPVAVTVAVTGLGLGSDAGMGMGMGLEPGAPRPAPPGEPRWTVLVRERLDVALAPAAALGWTIGGTGAALAVVFALIGWLVTGWITAPLRQIAAAAERIRRGEAGELPRLPGPPEIASLAASLHGLIASMSHKQLALEELEESSQRDPLTGLLNRHGLRTRLELVLREARVRGSALLIFVLDLDGFKMVNDRLGHASGDEVLCLVGRRLSMSVRPDDLVARIGGDEFVLALRAPHGFSDDTAREIAERALAAIGVPFYLDQGVARIGCSLGGACWTLHMDDVADSSGSDSIDDVMRKADSALYDVKRHGKGRVLLHGDYKVLEQ